LEGHVVVAVDITNQKLTASAIMLNIERIFCFVYIRFVTLRSRERMHGRSYWKSAETSRQRLHIIQKLNVDIIRRAIRREHDRSLIIEKSDSASVAPDPLSRHKLRRPAILKWAVMIKRICLVIG
jgi:hypothetical protein